MREIVLATRAATPGFPGRRRHARRRDRGHDPEPVMPHRAADETSRDSPRPDKAATRRRWANLRPAPPLHSRRSGQVVQEAAARSVPPVDRLFFIRVLLVMIAATLGSGILAVFLAFIGPAR
jgi:hypothetical protein